MKLQAINNGNSVSTKGSLHKLPQTGKFTNLAYSALFAASLLSAADSFSKSPAKEKLSAPKTEVVATAGIQSDREFEEQLLNILEERKRQREAEAEKARNEVIKHLNLNTEKYASEYKIKQEKEKSQMRIFYKLTLGALIGAALWSIYKKAQK